MNHAQRPSDASIDTLILQAEQRLIDREARWRHDVGAFGHQVHAATRPARLAQPALMAAAVAVIVLGWPSRRSEPSQEQQQPAGATAAAVARPALFTLLAGIPWTRLLSHTWPMLPERWRERLNPATAASILSLGLPVLEGFLTRRRSPPG